MKGFLAVVLEPKDATGSVPASAGLNMAELCRAGHTSVPRLLLADCQGPTLCLYISQSLHLPTPSRAEHPSSQHCYSAVPNFNCEFLGGTNSSPGEGISQARTSGLSPSWKRTPKDANAKVLCALVLPSRGRASVLKELRVR